MKKSHDSWKAWGAYRIEREMVKDFKSYQQEAKEDREVSSVFVIINEWVGASGYTSSEIVGAKYFTSEGEARDALKAIAEAFGVELGHDDMNIALEDHAPNLQYEEYYIQELTRG